MSISLTIFSDYVAQLHELLVARRHKLPSYSTAMQDVKSAEDNIPLPLTSDYVARGVHTKAELVAQMERRFVQQYQMVNEIDEDNDEAEPEEASSDED